MEGVVPFRSPGPAPLAQRKAYRGRRTSEMNQIDESLLVLPPEAEMEEEEEEEEEELIMNEEASLATMMAADRAQAKAQSMAKLSRRPEEVLRDLETEAEVLRNLHAKLQRQRGMLQVEEIVLKKQIQLSQCGEGH